MSNAPTDSMRYNSDIQGPPNHATDFHQMQNATSATYNNNDTNSVSGPTCQPTEVLVTPEAKLVKF